MFRSGLPLDVRYLLLTSAIAVAIRASNYLQSLRAALFQVMFKGNQGIQMDDFVLMHWRRTSPLQRN